jgi:hypothetical protein
MGELSLGRLQVVVVALEPGDLFHTGTLWSADPNGSGAD